MAHLISDRTLDQIIEEAFEAGKTYGEMRLMGKENYNEFREQSLFVIRSNAKSRLLEDARVERSHNEWMGL